MVTSSQPGSLHDSRVGTTYIIFNLATRVTLCYMPRIGNCELRRYYVDDDDLETGFTRLYQRNQYGGLRYIHALKLICE